jgi:aminopeptidase N
MNLKGSIFLVLICCFSCHILKKPSSEKEAAGKINGADTAAKSIDSTVYRPSRTRLQDLIHTKLEIRFDLSKAELMGKATLTLKPYFYPTDQLELDAKGFEIKEIALLSGNEKLKLEYTYNKDLLKIKLNKRYYKEENYTIYIEYIARPEALPDRGSEAISESKGLYFINAGGKIKDKPIQIWSQGETEASSCWFPTIDAPNERMTQEVYLTVDTGFVTLSNGLLEYGQDNGDGTRTDYWKQNLPAAPYLTMIAVGKYAVIKDKWRDIEVNYYVEPAFAKHARMIFGRTPEMLEYFSTKLGVPYPWEKYSQVVVREYVSGAMENTGAVVHGEFIQRDEREYLDQTFEEVIAHELFHHWFGDLVTCESWSNLPLNESFATYGEVLWNEKKHGQDAADYGLYNDLLNYIGQTKLGDHEPIWFDYEDREEMFDAVSYQKGARILHMLRNYLGDDAFFSSLKYYLNAHKFQSVEIHDLRLAFEHVTGEDLNWFFNQWFFRSGYPDIQISSTYNDSLKKEVVAVKQVHSETTPLEKEATYRLPLAIDIYAKGTKTRHQVVLEKESEKFYLDCPSKPDLVNFDGDKMLLCTKKEIKTLTEWAFQYHHAPKYMDRYEAIKHLGENFKKDSLAAKVILEGLHDPFWNIRSLAIRMAALNTKKKTAEVREKLIQMAIKDSSSHIRSLALSNLSKEYHDSSLVAIYKKSLADPSYLVEGTALEAMAKHHPDSALQLAQAHENEKNHSIILSISEIYASYGNEAQQPFFETALEKFKGPEKYPLVKSYSRYLLRGKDEAIDKGILILYDIAKNAHQWWLRAAALDGLIDLQKMYQIREKEMQDKLNEFIKQSKNPSEIISLKTGLEQAKKQKESLKEKTDALILLEKDKKKP